MKRHLGTAPVSGGWVENVSRGDPALESACDRDRLSWAPERQHREFWQLKSVRCWSRCSPGSGLRPAQCRQRAPDCGRALGEGAEQTDSPALRPLRPAEGRPGRQLALAPFEPTIRKGRRFARGVGDNKGQNLAQISAIESYLKAHCALPCNVILLQKGEDEIGSLHIADFLRAYKDNLKSRSCRHRRWSASCKRRTCDQVRISRRGGFGTALSPR
ncbi:M20/M25/M40 family metallo-hydrolase [Mesorhizobium sp.]|uniref:M20/M25/M40 family metallo-hydrolase n=1 Tax=Mesorhizobium sp. TaxID=1871066 RepID=UPI0025C282EC|nr:M20/M25/M40 family metallo-hydrolase [Mesorhizobium sp.]